MKIVIQETASEIKSLINEQIVKKLQVPFVSAAFIVLEKFKPFFIGLFEKSPEYISLISQNGKLRGSFGLTPITAKANVDAILYDLAESIVLDVKKLGYNNSGLTGGIEFGITKKDHTDIDFGLGSYIDDDGDFIEWLYWLLFEGTDNVILGFNIQFGKYPKQRSRSTIAIMVRGEGGWSVPDEFAGTSGDNWITRTINGNSRAMIDFINTNFEEEFKKRI